MKRLKSGKRCWLSICLAGTLLFNYGCTVTHVSKVGLNYKRAINASGGSGEIFIEKPVELFSNKKNPNGEVVLGDTTIMVDRFVVVTNDNVVDWVASALSQELGHAGYHVNFVTNLPKDARKGVRVTIYKVNIVVLAQGLSLVGTWTTTLQYSIDIWKNGVKVATFNLEGTGVPDGRHYFNWAESVSQSLYNAQKSAMKEILPKLIQVLEN